jgi:hypothetical protein
LNEKIPGGQVSQDGCRTPDPNAASAFGFVTATGAATSAMSTNVPRAVTTSPIDRFMLIPFQLRQRTRAPYCPEARKLAAEGLQPQWRLAPVGAGPYRYRRGVNVKYVREGFGFCAPSRPHPGPGCDVVVGELPSYLRIEERELEAGGLNELRNDQSRPAPPAVEL